MAVTPEQRRREMFSPQLFHKQEKTDVAEYLIASVTASALIAAVACSANTRHHRYEPRRHAGGMSFQGDRRTSEVIGRRSIMTARTWRICPLTLVPSSIFIAG
jgi:hypothetical protein